MTPRTSPTRTAGIRSRSPRRSLGDAQTITLGGEYAHVGAQLDLNGIDATPSGKTLVAVQTAGGKLYRIDATSGVAKLIDLGGETVPNGDGPPQGEDAVRRAERAE